MFSFTVEGRAVPQGSHSVIRGRVVAYRSRDLDAWRQKVGWLAKAAMPPGWEPCDAYAVMAIFQFERPRSHLTMRGLKSSAPKRMVNKPDLDKLARAVGDALTQAGCIKDDSLIVSWSLFKRYGDNDEVKISISCAEE